MEPIDRSKYDNPETLFIGTFVRFKGGGVPMPPGTPASPRPGREPKEPLPLTAEQLIELRKQWDDVAFWEIASVVQECADQLAPAAVGVAGEIAHQRLLDGKASPDETERHFLEWLASRGIRVP